jgi:hypothetical protein
VLTLRLIDGVARRLADGHHEPARAQLCLLAVSGIIASRVRSVKTAAT